MSRETKHNIVHELSKINTTLQPPDDIEPYELIENVKRFEMNECLSPYLESLLFQYSRQRFIWTGDNPSTLHLVADEEKIIRPAPDGKIIIVGSTRAELFIKALNRKYKILRIPKFPYSERFAYIVMKEDSKKASRKEMEKVLKELGKTNEETRLPLLVLTGSEKDQHRLKAVLGGIAHCSKDENEVGQKWNHKSGMINIFYQNSVISRGIDVDFYNLLFVYSSDFANPYWGARLAVAKDNEDVIDSDYVQRVIDSIIMDETTNSVLRISPVRSTTDDIPRIIIISEHDLWKIRPNVLDGMIKIDAITGFFNDNRLQVLAEWRTEKLWKSFKNIKMFTGINLENNENKENANYSAQNVGVCTPVFSDGDHKLALKLKMNDFISRLCDSEHKTFRSWRNNHNKITLTEVEDHIRKYLRNAGENKKRISEKALIKQIVKTAPKFKKNDYSIENIMRIILDMIMSGEVIREGVGQTSMLSIRERYVAPELEEGEGFVL